MIGKFSIVVADPPWRFSDKLAMSDVKRGAEANYSTLSLDDIKRLPVNDWCADSAVLALWVPSSLLQDGLDVMAAWGFKQKQIYTWLKASKNPRPARSPSFASAQDAWTRCLDASAIDDYDAARSDAKYLRWKRGEGPQPDPFPGGVFDEINEALDGYRVSGGAEGFCRLLGRSRSWADVPPIAQIMKNISGLDRFRLPDHIQDALIDLDVDQESSWLDTKLAFGMGHHFRGCTEHALIGTTGRPKPDSRSQRNAHLSPALKHSQKGEELMERLELMYPEPRLELFARRSRPGWLCFGNEAPGFEGRDIRNWTPFESSTVDSLGGGQ